MNRYLHWLIGIWSMSRRRFNRRAVV